jgi:hypothetical protein
MRRTVMVEQLVRGHAAARWISRHHDLLREYRPWWLDSAWVTVKDRKLSSERDELPLARHMNRASFSGRLQLLS